MNSPTRDSAFKKVKIEDNITTFPKDSPPIEIIKKYIEQYIEKGSINECIINLCIISLGMGLLEIPQKAEYLGLFIIPIIIIIYGVINYWTFIVLTDAARKYKVNKYEDLIAAMFNPYFTKFFVIMMFLGLLGSIIFFQVMLYKFFGGIYNEIFSYGFVNMDIFSRGSFWTERETRLIVCYSTAIFILVPLCLFKTFSQLRFITAFGVFAVFLVIFIVVIQFPGFYYYNIFERRMRINYLDYSQGFAHDLKFISSFYTIIYAYECHAGIFPVISSLSDPTKERVNYVLKTSSIINTVSYIIITLTGYLSQPSHTPEIILEREKISDSDYLKTISLFLFSFTIIAKIGALFNCLRGLLLNAMKFDLDNYPNGINFILIIFVFSFTTFAASTFQNISDYISLINTFYGLLIAVVMPAIIYIKCNDKPFYKKYFAFVFILIICLIGFFTVYFTLKKIFRF